MNRILQRSAGVFLALALCLVNGAGWVDAQTAGDSAEPSKPADGIKVIEAWVESITGPLNTNEAPVSVAIEPKADNVYFVSLIIEGKTSESHGLLRLAWDQKQVANLTLVTAVVAGQDHCYVISTIGGFSELRAPLGKWQLAEEGVPSAYSGIIPRVGTTIPRPNVWGGTPDEDQN